MCWPVMRPQLDFVHEFVPGLSNQSLVLLRAQKTCRFGTSSKLIHAIRRQDLVQRNYFLKNCRPARVQPTDGKVRKASLKGRLSLNRFWPNYQPATFPRPNSRALLRSKTAQ